MEVVRSALAGVKGVNDIRIAGAVKVEDHPMVKFKGQLIQYSGSAHALDVIAILHRKTNFTAKLAKAPKNLSGNRR